ncbi:MAG: hypothetical protein ACK5NK_07435 [Niabella sp.]
MLSQSNLFLLTFIFFYCSNLLSDQNTIKGIVIDFDNEPLSNAIVSVKNTTVLTNNQGKFAILLPDNYIEDSVSIIVDYVGMNRATNRIKIGDSCFIQMVRSGVLLEEVVVSTSASNIIKKAIKKIPQNYGIGKLAISGVYRTYHLAKDGDRIKKYFTADAFLEMRYKDYCNKNLLPSIYVLQNKVAHANFGVNKDTGRWVNGYMVSSQDIVNTMPDYFSLSGMKKFTYKNLGRISIGNRTVYKINFYNNYNDNIDGTLFIDTATYAVTAANINKYHIKKLFYKEIDKSIINISYELEGSRWYLSSIKMNTSYVSDNLKLSRITSFKTIKTAMNFDDKTPIKGIKVERGIQDNTYHIMTSINDSIRLDSIADIMQNNGQLPIQQLPSKTLSQTPIQKSENKTSKKILEYIYNNNVQLSLGVLKNSIIIDYQENGSSGFSNFDNYALLAEYNFRIYKSLFLNYAIGGNIGSKNVKFSIQKLGISYQLAIPDRKYPFVFCPIATAGFGKYKIDKTKVATYTSFETGLYIKKHFGRKLVPFIQTSYSPFFKEKLIDSESIKLKNNYWMFHTGLQINL